MIVLACPGQGSQTSGFLTEWIKDKKAKETLLTLSHAADVDLIKHGTVSDDETIRDTSIAQPLIVAASILSWQALSEMVDLSAVGVAGHSVGEFAAAAISGVLTPEESMKLVGERGRAMADAAANVDTSMAAVIGSDENAVLQLIAEHGLTAANRNGANQIVAAGIKEDILKMSENAPRGIRVVPLQVAGAFHTEFMRPAIARLEEAAKHVNPQNPTHPLWTNNDGSLISDGAKYLSLLITQVASPVRWDLCLESFSAQPISAFAELTPAGALSGIAKRALRGIPNLAIKTPADLEEAAITIRSLQN